MTQMSGTIKNLLANLQKGNKEQVLADFWKEVETLRSPLIEPTEDPSQYLVTFLWKGSSDHTNVVVTNYGLVSYDPKDNQMTNIPETDVWYRSYVLPKGLRTAYNISINDPLVSICNYRIEEMMGVQILSQWALDPFNSSTYHVPSSLSLLQMDQTLSVVELPGSANLPWRDRSSLQSSLEKMHVPSALLGEGREVYVFLPPAYNAKRSTPYPLLVTFDGYAFAEMMHAQQLLEHLIVQGELPPLIAVMICNPEPNSVTRMRDLSCNPMFAEFVAKELLPWIEQRWNVTHSPKETVIAGCSMGGLAASYTALCYPEHFGNVISQSGSYWWSIGEKRNFLINACKEKEWKEIRFYLDVGSLEVAKTFEQGLSFLASNQEFAQVLSSKGYDVLFDIFPGGHDYFCWEATFPKAIKSMLVPQESFCVIP